ncbi:HAD-IA family hydrolase [Actinoplanes sp. Pm04-4]|uniref:HAD-IA family hydrolase n=1 Tax=Paractinoplanes pyxinae TaxID=2997416 RepID=A0ABT4B330_9ACTN|nr:HAD-IA family hydrolase [Actinoplanes pyxinae]MCY1140896.1 HAD-IA family hydrolase [Actinoplanes pyxinae]
MSKRVVLLDLDGTLLDYSDDDWRLTVRATCAGLATAAPGLDAAALATTYERICLGHWRVAASAVMLAPSGSPHGHDVWREHWHEALRVHGHGDTELARHAFELYRADRLARYRLYPDVPAALARLRELADGLAVVTNGPGDTQREKIAATGLDAYVDVVVTSGETGHAKPRPEIFHIALRELDATPDEAWHIGDSLTSDVAGARNAGLAGAVWLNRTGAAGQ